MAEVATKGQVIVRHGNEGDAIWAVGSLFMVKLAVEESAGPLSVMQVISTCATHPLIMQIRTSAVDSACRCGDGTALAVSELSGSKRAASKPCRPRMSPRCGMATGWEWQRRRSSTTIPAPGMCLPWHGNCGSAKAKPPK